jgi:hypothetical protein
MPRIRATNARQWFSVTATDELRDCVLDGLERRVIVRLTATNIRVVCRAFVVATWQNIWLQYSVPKKTSELFILEVMIE